MTFSCDPAQLERWNTRFAADGLRFLARGDRESADARARGGRHGGETLVPGGLLIPQGYRPKQMEYGTGGPPQVENLYTEELLRELLRDWEILHLASRDDAVDEGAGHKGMSALIDAVARA